MSERSSFDSENEDWDEPDKAPVDQFDPDEFNGARGDPDEPRIEEEDAFPMGRSFDYQYGDLDDDDENDDKLRDETRKVTSPQKAKKRLVKKGDGKPVSTELRNIPARRDSASVEDPEAEYDGGEQAWGREDMAAELGGEEEEDDMRHIPQAVEEDGELDRIFKRGRKRKVERSLENIHSEIEALMASMEEAARKDAAANRNGKPALHKLILLPKVKEVLKKKYLHSEFLEQGIFSTLKLWLEPLPDGCLPNTVIRTAVLQILQELPVDLEEHHRRTQLKLSGLGKVIMFYSKYPEETMANRKLARDLVEAWSRPLFQKSTNYEDLKHDERAMRELPADKEDDARKRLDGDQDDLDLSDEEDDDKDSSRRYARRPKPRAMNFVNRPESKLSNEAIANKKIKREGRHHQMTKKLQKLAGPKRQNMRAQTLSVEGRGLFKFG